MSHEEDGIRYDVVMDNRYRMTRLITGETELYDHTIDPREWNNLDVAGDHSEAIERLEQHLTFAVPTIDGTNTADGWLEAEDLPCQTSADHGRRGNFHYSRPNPQASSGRYLCVELTQGEDSYVDFVVNIEQPGTYDFAAETISDRGVFRVLLSAARLDTSPLPKNRRIGSSEYCVHADAESLVGQLQGR